MLIAMSVAISIRHLLGHESGGSSLLPDYPYHSYKELQHILVHCNFAPSTSVACHLVSAHQIITIELIRLNIMLSVVATNYIHH